MHDQNSITETVAAVDGTTTDPAVLRWAVDDARRHHRPMRVLHVNVWAARALALRPAWAVPPDAAAELLAERTLAGAVAAATQLAAQQAARPGNGGEPVTVVGELAAGLAADVLVDRSSRSSLLVLGSRGAGKGGGLRAELGLGSTSSQVARHAPGPVVVVPPDPGLDQAKPSKDGAQHDGGESDEVRSGNGRPAETGTSRIVVGVDGSRRSQLALAVGFEEASLRGVPLVAVHAWHSSVLDAPALISPDPPTQEELTAEQERVLSEAIVGWREKYPDVAVSTGVVHAHPAVALLQSTVPRDLLVVCSRGSGELHELLLGSVTRAILHRSRCTVLVVHQR